jgi:hypothetical protein
MTGQTSVTADRLLPRDACGRRYEVFHAVENDDARPVKATLEQVDGYLSAAPATL